mmetsp:Transcript_45523/g.106941  ORF Transcript_45523/g.106941 Transcript_45523/m.106941 type:complete len:261 (+) Transcript_45523:2580-3362(+)
MASTRSSKPLPFSSSPSTALYMRVPDSMMWIVTTSSSSSDVVSWPGRLKNSSAPLRTSVISPPSMPPVSMCDESVLASALLATFSNVRSCARSDSVPAEPTMMSTSATALRLVSALASSHHVFTPPSTTDTMPFSRVWTAFPESSMAETTSSIKSISRPLLHAFWPVSKNAMPTGTFIITNRSLNRTEFWHIVIAGAHVCPNLSPNVRRIASSSHTACSDASASSALAHAWNHVAEEKRDPRPTRTAPSGTMLVLGLAER